MNKLVSILMPAKNAALYIDACIQSIIDQSYQNWELLVVNDHSTDQTLLHLERYATVDNRIQIHHNNGQGIISALQLAYSKSKGNYLTRMDADDIMVPHKLDALLLALSDYDCVATGLVTYFSEAGIGDGYKKYTDWMNTNLLSDNPFSDIYKECVIPSPCWMMHRTTFDKIGAFESDTYPEDYDLSFRMHKFGLKVKTVESVLHQWRDYPERSSRTDDNYADNRFLALKVNYFAELEYEDEMKVCLWGSGKKGKAIAKLLQEQNIPFLWTTNNQNKIGHSIYDVLLKDESALLEAAPTKVIIAIAGEEDQQYIRSVIDNNGHLTPYWFC